MNSKRKLAILQIYWDLMNFLESIFNLIGLELRFYNPSTSEKALLKYLLKKYNITVLLDVGASKGQFGKKLLSTNYKGRLYSFEPISDSFSVLDTLSKKHANWTAFHMGLGEKEETITMNISLNSDSSSILEMHDTHVKNADIAAFYKKETINISTLDKVVHSQQLDSRSMYLKMDVQGYEKMLLLGAKEILPQIKIIQTELSLTTLYHGGSLIEEMIGLLREEGFELYSLVPGFKNKRTGQILQMDGFFINKRFGIA